MHISLKGIARISILIIASAAVTSPVFADKPDWAGGGRGGEHERSSYRHERREHERREHERREHERRERERGRPRFDQARRDRVRAYYAREMRRGHCPPGLRRNHHRCTPPGLARKWRIGARLPRDVVFHNLTPQLRIEIGVPPAGYRYVQVANDILMITAGTGMVVDAINDLGR